MQNDDSNKRTRCCRYAIVAVVLRVHGVIATRGDAGVGLDGELTFRPPAPAYGNCYHAVYGSEVQPLFEYSVVHHRLLPSCPGCRVGLGSASGLTGPSSNRSRRCRQWGGEAAWRRHVAEQCTPTAATVVTLALTTHFKTFQIPEIRPTEVSQWHTAQFAGQVKLIGHLLK